MQTTELPEKNEKPARGLRADWPYFVYDHWYIDENGNLAWNMVIPEDVIRERRLTDLESMGIALQDPPDLPEDFCEEAVKHEDY